MQRSPRPGSQQPDVHPLPRPRRTRDCSKSVPSPAPDPPTSPSSPPSKACTIRLARPRTANPPAPGPPDGTHLRIRSLQLRTRQTHHPSHRTQIAGIKFTHLPRRVRVSSTQTNSNGPKPPPEKPLPLCQHLPHPQKPTLRRAKPSLPKSNSTSRATSSSMTGVSLISNATASPPGASSHPITAAKSSC
jgi:hypothetical protein